MLSSEALQSSLPRKITGNYEYSYLSALFSACLALYRSLRFSVAESFLRVVGRSPFSSDSSAFEIVAILYQFSDGSLHSRRSLFAASPPPNPPRI